MSATRSERKRWIAMPFIALGVAMIIVDATIVNVAIPTIIRELQITAATAEWTNSIYSLVFASLLITLGRIGNMVGRRRLFFVGTVVFVVASLVAATRPQRRRPHLRALPAGHGRGDDPLRGA